MKILINIAANKKTCGKCKELFAKDWCPVFNIEIKDSKRCPACLKAEHKEKRGL